MNSSIPSPFSLIGQLALITGGGTGLGFGVARCFVQAGARVVLVGRREDVLHRAVSELGKQASYRSHDILEFSRNDELIDGVESTIGPVDILVNNAGNYLKKSALDTSEAEFHSIVNTHVLGAFSMTRAAAQRMTERRKGSILFIASMASFLGIQNILAYSAAKSACPGMVRGLAAELSPRGIRVNAIAPGWIQTAMTDAAFADDPARKEKVLARTPLGRLGNPEDIGYAAVYLSSPAAKFVTGTVLTVDGGASIGF